MAEIPEAIKEAFADTLEANDGRIVFAGSKDGVDYYVYEFHEEVFVGYPEVYGYDGEGIVNVEYGEPRIDLPNSFAED